jgi:hypothetical protein
MIPVALPAATTGVLIIDWDANTTDLDLNGYRIFMSTDPNVFDLTPAQARAGANTRAVPPDIVESLFSSLETTSTYYIAVTCFDASGNESVFSPVVAAQPCDATTSGSLTVSWDPAEATSSTTGHRVYLATSPDVFEQEPGEVLSRTTTRTVAAGATATQFNHLDATKTYWVSVTSYDGEGTESAFSEILAVTPTLMPTLCSVSPYSAPQGTAGVDVTLYGTNFQPGATASFGPDITVRSLDTSGAPTRVVARVDVGPFAQVESRDVMITNPDGGLSIIQEAFDVLVDLDRVDINGSSRIDGGDMVQVAAAFTARSGDPRYSVSWDLNVDGVVDGTDLSLLIVYFGSIGPF